MVISIETAVTHGDIHKDSSPLDQHTVHQANMNHLPLPSVTSVVFTSLYCNIWNKCTLFLRYSSNSMSFFAVLIGSWATKALDNVPHQKKGNMCNTVTSSTVLLSFLHNHLPLSAQVVRRVYHLYNWSVVVFLLLFLLLCCCFFQNKIEVYRRNY